jgi:adenine phosphoribosyltransferase
MATTVHFITTSQPKLAAFNSSKWWKITNMRLESECGSVPTDTPQPVGYEAGLAMARQRITRYKAAVADYQIRQNSDAKRFGRSQGDIYLAVESYMDQFKRQDGSEIWVDRALAVCQFGDLETKEIIVVSTQLIHMPQDLVQSYFKVAIPHDNQLGYKTTFGEYISVMNKMIPKDDWYLHVGCDENMNRQTHIRNLLNQIPLAPLLCAKAPVYQDFPKPGVRFLDVISLLADATTKRMLTELVQDKLCVGQRTGDMPPTHVVGLDARGFLLGMLVADTLNIPFIPIRKAGKLPPSPKLQRVEYQTEYSTDAFEMAHQAGIKPNSRVLVVDDILATGGTIRAALQLLEKYELLQAPKILVAADVLGLEHHAAIKDNLVVLFAE